MRLIALDAAPGVPSVCLYADGMAVAHWRGEPKTTPRAVLDAVRSLLTGAGLSLSDLDTVACGQGPGAFTGVRLALALAQGLALGSELPLVTVSDLAALAWSAGRRHGWPRVLACMDARRGEVYWGTYACLETQAEALGPEAVSPPERVVPPAGSWPAAGGGADALARAGLPLTGVDASLAPDARGVAELAGHSAASGHAHRPESAAPVYLRTRVAVESRERHNSSVT